MKTIAVAVQNVRYLLPAYAQALARREPIYLQRFPRAAEARVDMTSELGRRIAAQLVRLGVTTYGFEYVGSKMACRHHQDFIDGVLTGVDELHLLELDPDCNGTSRWILPAKRLRVPTHAFQLWRPVEEETPETAPGSDATQ